MQPISHMMCSLLGQSDVGARLHAASVMSAALKELRARLHEARWDNDDQVAAAWQNAETELYRLWPSLVTDLGGRETQAQVLEELCGAAKSAAGLLLYAAEVSANKTASGLRGGTNGDGMTAITAATSGSGSPFASVKASVVWASQHVIGASGAACCHHLSVRPEWELAWLQVLRHVLKALRCVEATEPLPLLPMWACLKGVPGLRNSSADVRTAAVLFLHDALALQYDTRGVVVPSTSNGAVQGSTASETSKGSPEAVSGSSGVRCDVNPWVVCQELACRVAAEDSDPRVRAAALRAAAALLGLGMCLEQLSGREWRRLAEGVLQAAAPGATAAMGQSAGSKASEIWDAVLSFTRQQGSHPGWRGAVRQLGMQLQQAAATEEGPMSVYGISTICRTVAGAAAVQAALEQPALPDLLGQQQQQQEAAAAWGSSGSPTEVAVKAAEIHSLEPDTLGLLLQSLATCLSDAMRCDKAAATHGSLEEAWQRLLLQDTDGVLAQGDVTPTATTPDTRNPPGNERRTDTSVKRGEPAAPVADAWEKQEQERPEELGVGEADALVVAGAVCAASCSVGRLLGAAGSLEALETLVARAEVAPLVYHPTAPVPPPPASRPALLAAASALAAGAAEALRAAAGDGGGSVGVSIAPYAAAAAGGATQLQLPAQHVSASQLATAVRLARLMRRIAGMLQAPDKLLFADVGGAPAAPEPAAAAAAQQHRLCVVAGAALLSRLLGVLPAPLGVRPGGSDGRDSSGGEDGEDGTKQQEGKAEEEQEEEPAVGGASHEQRKQQQFQGRSRRPVVVIEELPSSPTHASSPHPNPSLESQAAQHWRQQQQPLVSELLLLCATYAAPSRTQHQQQPPAAAVQADPPGFGAGSRSGSAAAGSAPAAAADPGLPPPPRDVFTPWADSGVSGVTVACEGLLGALHARTRASPAPSRALRSSSAASGCGAASLALLTAEEVSEQDLIASCLPELLRDKIRPIVVQRHVQELEEGPIKPYTGPDTFTRAVAARRLAWLLMRSRHPFVGEALRLALPAVLACCDDPAPGVGQYGISMLHAVAVECLAADLQWQRELLLEQARRLVVGCQEQLWRLACPAAVALVRRIEGKDPRAPGFHRLASELLTEAERQAHVPARRTAFLPPAACLLTCLGLTSLRYAGRLMPLLLEWLHAHDEETRVGSLRVLAVVVRVTWPRVEAHAEALWRHLLLVLLRCGEEGEEGEEARVAREVCGLLLACAREEVVGFQPAAAGLPEGAEQLHRRMVACGRGG
ncbi:hypothetical protein Agub_g10106 [Astrephomene gubernaculifera]|uniref:Uncharacterized protein n=1 Tax=Astrephomene gubernaculifera TaxID=47775 RepID=A0AAD3HPF2_9CHLO|nr:hypothetical protein Agub_g10106 [Astrephomene gubernaculifera]